MASETAEAELGKVSQGAMWRLVWGGSRYQPKVVGHMFFELPDAGSRLACAPHASMIARPRKLVNCMV